MFSKQGANACDKETKSDATDASSSSTSSRYNEFSFSLLFYLFFNTEVFNKFLRYNKELSLIPYIFIQV